MDGSDFDADHVVVSFEPEVGHGRRLLGTGVPDDGVGERGRLDADTVAADSLHDERPVLRTNVGTIHLRSE